jgi:hypothetical protein
VAPFHVAFVHVGLGDNDAAIAALELAAEQRNALAWWVTRAPEFTPLRSDPRFEAVLRRIVPA